MSSLPPVLTFLNVTLVFRAAAHYLPLSRDPFAPRRRAHSFSVRPASAAAHTALLLAPHSRSPPRASPLASRLRSRSSFLLFILLLFILLLFILLLFILLFILLFLLLLPPPLSTKILPLGRAITPTRTNPYNTLHMLIIY
ncbi:hypothetical protein BC826DRAFT_1189506 [Russula brevipes]|nr:hypothetical protein BC826DRAFT_1189506 [Russula brevipes]